MVQHTNFDEMTEGTDYYLGYLITYNIKRALVNETTHWPIININCIKSSANDTK